MFKKLIKGQIDVVILNSYSGDYLIKKLGLESKIKTESYKYVNRNSSDTRAGFGKNERNQKLLKIFNKRYKELENQGVIEKIVKKYS